jgi:predicted membrane channel-forming protein YqfA (hemolysin III family)
MSSAVTTRRVVIVLAVGFLGLGTLQAIAAVASDESTQLLVIRLSAVGMFLLLGAIVYVLRSQFGAAEE